MKDEYTLPMAILLLLFILGACLCLPGIKKDLQRQQWCREQGWECGIVKLQGRYYCASRPVPVELPEYLQ